MNEDKVLKLKRVMEVEIYEKFMNELLYLSTDEQKYAEKSKKHGHTIRTIEYIFSVLNIDMQTIVSDTDYDKIIKMVNYNIKAMNE